MEEGEISRANCFAEAATLDATQQLPGDAAGLIGIAIFMYPLYRCPASAGRISATKLRRIGRLSGKRTL